ncbi:MAG: ABC transporter permease [Acidobacteria bacterium]|nr:ABC transporter permease [Acidobacteriota bacterium]
MSNLTQDLRYALRNLRKNPGFYAVAILALALGIGANTAIFSVINGVLLRPLAYSDPGQLVRVWGRQEVDHTSHSTTSPLDIVDWNAQSKSFEGIAAHTFGGLTLTGIGEPQQLRIMLATQNYFSVLGMQPQRGRFFITEEGQVGKHRVLILSDAFWRRQFNADPQIIGRSLTLNGFAYNVIGVAPPGMKDPFGSAREPDGWRPLPIPQDQGARGGHYVFALGRLKPGVPLAQAQAEMDTITRNLEKQYPGTNTGQRVDLEPLQSAVVGDSRNSLLLVFAAVGFVLLIACANVANLLLARASSRQREIAIRSALGAGRGRLVAQFLTECVLLSLVGGLAGFLLALWGVDLLVAHAPADFPRLDEISVNASVLGFTLFISLLTAAVFGLAPAWQATKTNLTLMLNETGRVSAGRERNRLRSLLLVGEVALSLVLLFGAGLLIRSFWSVLQVSPGFRAENLTTLQMDLPGSRYKEEPQIKNFYATLFERTAALPGVQAAGAVNNLPMSGSYSCDSFALSDRAAPPEGQEPCAETRSASPGYLAAMSIPLLRGRWIEQRDSKDSALVVVINETMARRYWPGQNPLGQKFKWGDIRGTDPWKEIVGVIGDVRHFGLEEQIRPEVYMPHAQGIPFSGMTLVLRSSGDARPLIAALRSAIHEMDRDLPVSKIKSMEEWISGSLAQRRFSMTLLVAFASLALLLAAVGIYGVMSYSVTQRTREIGIRMALGARRGDVLRLVVGRSMALSFAGVALGAVLSLALGRLMSTLLFGITPVDVPTFLATALLLATVALAASYLPARRAARVDPLVALRYE